LPCSVFNAVAGFVRLPLNLHCSTDRSKKDTAMAKPNYQFEKRQKELAKKNKREEKRRQKGSTASVTDAAGPANANGLVDSDLATTVGLHARIVE
jgi:hypothetical protein